MFQYKGTWTVTSRLLLDASYGSYHQDWNGREAARQQSRPDSHDGTVHGWLREQRWRRTRPGLSRAGVERRLHGAEPLAGGGDLRHRRTQHEGRLSRRVPLEQDFPARQQPQPRIPGQQRRAEPAHAVGEAVLHGLARAIRRVVRTGPVDSRKGHRPGSHPLRPRLELLSRAADRTDPIHPGGARLSEVQGRDRLSRHQPAVRPRLRRVRQREDRREVQHGPVSRSRGQRQWKLLGVAAEQPRPNKRDAVVDRRQRQLHPRLRSAERRGAGSPVARRRQLRAVEQPELREERVQPLV